MDCSMSDFPVHHQLLELAQTHVRWVGDAIQPSHPVIPLSSCLQSFPASGSFLVSQFFASSGQSIEASALASVLPIFRTDFLYDGLVWSFCSPRDSQESFPTCSSKASIPRPSAFFMVQLSHPQWSSLVARMIKHLPAVWETQVPSLGQEDSLEKEMATHSSILTWRISWMEEPGRLQYTWSQGIGHNWATSLSFSFSHIHTWLLEKP